MNQLGRPFGRVTDRPPLDADRRAQAEGTVELVTLGALIYGLVRRDYLLVGIVGVYLAISLTAEIYRRFGARATKVEMRFLPRRIFPDQDVELRARLVNEKRLPLPWIRLVLSLPRQFRVESLTTIRTPEFLRLSLPLAVGGRSAVERRVRFQVKERGAHRLGVSELIVVDPLGIRSTETPAPTEGELLVYPRLLPVGAHLRQNLPISERRGPSFVDEPSRYLGPRAYRPGDPLRRIDWRRSAVLGDLHVKTFETVATSASAIFLDPSTSARSWEGIETEVLERTVSVVAGIAHHLIDRGDAVGLYVTGVFSGTHGHRPFSVREQPRSGVRQLSRILEALAKLRPPGLFRDLPIILLEEVPRLDYSVQIIVVAPYLTSDLAHALDRLSRSRRVFFLSTGEAHLEEDVRLPRHVRPLGLEPV